MNEELRERVARVLHDCGGKVSLAPFERQPVGWQNSKRELADAAIAAVREYLPQLRETVAKALRERTKVQESLAYAEVAIDAITAALDGQS